MRFKPVHGHISLNVWGLSTAYFCGIGPVVVCKRATRASNSHSSVARPCQIIQNLSQFYPNFIQNIFIKSGKNLSWPLFLWVHYAGTLLTPITAFIECHGKRINFWRPFNIKIIFEYRISQNNFLPRIVSLL